MLQIHGFSHVFCLFHFTSATFAENEFSAFVYMEKHGSSQLSFYHARVSLQNANSSKFRK